MLHLLLKCKSLADSNIRKVLFSIYIVFGCIWRILVAFKSLDRKQSQFQTPISGRLTFSTPQLVQPSPVARQQHPGVPPSWGKKRKAPLLLRKWNFKIRWPVRLPTLSSSGRVLCGWNGLDSLRFWCFRLVHQSCMPLVPESTPRLH